MIIRLYFLVKKVTCSEIFYMVIGLSIKVDSRIKIAGTLLCQYMCPQFLRPRANRGLIVLNIFWYVFFYNLFHDSFFLLAKHFHASDISLPVFLSTLSPLAIHTGYCRRASL